MLLGKHSSPIEPTKMISEMSVVPAVQIWRLRSPSFSVACMLKIVAHWQQIMRGLIGNPERSSYATILSRNNSTFIESAAPLHLRDPLALPCMRVVYHRKAPYIRGRYVACQVCSRGPANFLLKLHSPSAVEDIN